MTNEIFTGGHFSSGTRVIQFLLEQTHNICSNNTHKDYEPGFDVPQMTFSELWLKGGKPKLKRKYGDKTYHLKKPFALKNPDFMLSFPRLKQLFPESKTILVVRNGLDQILCDNRAMFHRFARYFGMTPLDLKATQVDYLKGEMKFWNEAYKYSLENGVDCVVRLEDLVNDTENVVGNLFKWLDIPYPDVSMIKKPKSMGRYKNPHIIPDTHGYRPQHLKKVRYNPSMIPALYEVGKEMMDQFGYDKDICGYL